MGGSSNEVGIPGSSCLLRRRQGLVDEVWGLSVPTGRWFGLVGGRRRELVGIQIRELSDLGGNIIAQEHSTPWYSPDHLYVFKRPIEELD